MKSDTNQENILKLHASLQETRKNLEATQDRNQFFEIATNTRKKIEPIFEQFSKDVQNGTLPPLPELSAINHAFLHYWMYSEAINLLFGLVKYLENQRAYLRYLFEVGENFPECDCLILARLPVKLSPRYKKLQKIGGSEDLYDTYTDYECEVCGSHWRLQDTSTESVSDSHWQLLKLEPEGVIFPDYDKYGKALAESLFQPALNVDTLRQILGENLEMPKMDGKEDSLLLSRLAMLGIVEEEGLRKIITDNLNKAGEKKVRIWDIMDSFLDEEAERWPI